jgi:hypothetical protein
VQNALHVLGQWHDLKGKLYIGRNVLERFPVSLNDHGAQGFVPTYYAPEAFIQGFHIDSTD